MTWTSLVQAAIAWKTVKLFRLARRRLANQGDGSGSVTLANLSQEVFKMTEESLAGTLRSEITKESPFQLPERLCCRRIHAEYWLDIWHNFEHYADTQGDSYTSEGCFNAASFKAFQESPAYQVLSTEPWWTAHADSNACENKIARDEFFECIRLEIAPEDTPPSMFLVPVVSYLRLHVYLHSG